MSERFVVLSPSESMIEELVRLGPILEDLAARGNAQSPAVSVRIPPLHARMERAREAAGRFDSSAELTPGLRQIVDDHNALVQRIRADWISLCRDAADLLKPFRLQAPSLLDQTARKLLQSGKFDPRDAETKCNLFVQAIAVLLFGYKGFAGQDANQMAATLGRDASNWERLYDPQVDQAGEEPVAAALRLAQELANRGRLVVIAWEDTAEPAEGEKRHGHVAMVLPGRARRSTLWDMDVPLIAQAGDRVFPKSDEVKPEEYKLSEGFKSAMKLQIVVYALKPHGGAH